uniref:Uncharacterized protein n=1 Tax=Sphaerodactylus townsendi TaxID=933632 RepID=A0ACB8EI64_9SAUR
MALGVSSNSMILHFHHANKTIRAAFPNSENGNPSCPSKGLVHILSAIHDEIFLNLLLNVKKALMQQEMDHRWGEEAGLNLLFTIFLTANEKGEFLLAQINK